MNISSARQLNDRNHGADVRIRVNRFLFPHGCLWWRECPNCGKLSSYIGDVWRVDSETLLPPPPLKAFACGIPFESWCKDDKERDEWCLGKVDARACVHCETLTYAYHTPVVMQTSFKTPPPPFLEEIQREMRVVVGEADHIVLMGYSLPSDDVTYRAFLATNPQGLGAPSDVQRGRQASRLRESMALSRRTANQGPTAQGRDPGSATLRAGQTSAISVAGFPRCSSTGMQRSLRTPWIGFSLGSGLSSLKPRTAMARARHAVSLSICTSLPPQPRPLAHRERFAFQRPVDYPQKPLSTVAASDGRRR